MRARLLVIVLVLVGALAVGLGVPLAVSDARARQLQLFANRLTDTISFASLAGRPIAEGNLAGLQPELARYDTRVRRRRAGAGPGQAAAHRVPRGAAGAGPERLGAGGEGPGQPPLRGLPAADALGRAPGRAGRAGARRRTHPGGRGHDLLDRRAARRRAPGVVAGGRGRAARPGAGRDRRAADRALDPASGAPARRGHRPGRGRGAGRCRPGSGGRRVRALGAAPALRVVRPDGRDGDPGLRRRSAPSSPTPATSCATRSPRSGCACPTWTVTWTRPGWRTRSPRWRRRSG